MEKERKLGIAGEANRYKAALSAHEMKCRQIFDEIENGEDIYISVDQPITENSYIIEDTNEALAENTQYVRISLLSDRMLEYDSEMFEIRDKATILNKYRPYFVSFIVPLEDNSLHDIQGLGRKWHIGRFINSEELKADDGILLNGILETSASPVSYLKGKLLVFKNKAISASLLNQISSTYDPHSFAFKDNQDIENILQTAWSGDFPEKIDIYNVGHGNADYIRGAHHRILYDVGYNYRSLPQQRKGRYQKAAAAIRQLKPNCVILSHWDLDHIVGCAYAKQDLFRKKWVAPYLVSARDKKATPNSVRLAQYLNILDSLYLVDRDQSNKLIATIPCANDVEMKLWLGSGTSTLTAKNREGLLVEIIDRSGACPHVLLAGDVPYQCMPNHILQNPIDFMHVPHHCSKMELGRLKSVPGKGNCAVISTNRKGDKDLNCDGCHYAELKNKFMCAIATIEHPSGDDAANLSVEISYSAGGGTYRLR